MEEFLTENGIPTDPNGNTAHRNQPRDHNVGQNIGGAPEMGNTNGCIPTVGNPPDGQMMAGPSRIPNHHSVSQMRSALGQHESQRSRSPSPTGSASSGISHDMSSDTSPDSSQAAGKKRSACNRHQYSKELQLVLFF